nr:MAG TPA: hypothetical protein [Caudoviricetes sp.]
MRKIKKHTLFIEYAFLNSKKFENLLLIISFFF